MPPTGPRRWSDSSTNGTETGRLRRRFIFEARNRLLAAEQDHHVEQPGGDSLTRQGDTGSIHQDAGLDTKLCSKSTDDGLYIVMIKLRNRSQAIGQRAQITPHLLILQEFFNGGGIEF